MKYAQFEELQTEHLLLRKIKKEDAKMYFKQIGSSVDVTKYMLWQPHQSFQESVESIEKVLARYENGKCYTWGIALAEDDSIIGKIDLLRFDEENSSCSFAYMIGKEFWGRGLGTESLKAVFSFAFDKMEMQSIRADHISENVGSGKVMQKAGMKFVKRHSQKYEKCGHLYDADEYMIEASMWEMNK